MKKRTMLLLGIVFFVLFGAAMHATASANTQVTDQGEILSGEEESRLAKLADAAREVTGWDIMLVSSRDTNGMDAKSYAEAWANDHTQGDDGVIGLIDMANRELVISAYGEAIAYLTDERKEKILNDAYDGASQGDYAAAFTAMVDGIEEAYRQRVPKGQYTYDEDTGEILERQSKRQIRPWELLLALGAAILAGVGCISAVVGRYRMKWGGYQYSWRENGNVILTRKEDSFRNRVVTHRRIPKSTGKGNKTGAKSTVHTGAGGRKYSSRSKKF